MTQAVFPIFRLENDLFRHFLFEGGFGAGAARGALMRIRSGVGFAIASAASGQSNRGNHQSQSQNRFHVRYLSFLFA